MTTGCVFCGIVAGTEAAVVHHRFLDTIVITPLNPVVDGHRLLISAACVPDFTTDPVISAALMARAATYCSDGAWNVITSKGREATQTVRHLHLHLIPRHDHDNVNLPWDVHDRRRVKFPWTTKTGTAASNPLERKPS